MRVLPKQACVCLPDVQLSQSTEWNHAVVKGVEFTERHQVRSTSSQWSEDPKSPMAFRKDCKGSVREIIWSVISPCTTPWLTVCCFRTSTAHLPVTADPVCTLMISMQLTSTWYRFQCLQNDSRVCLRKLSAAPGEEQSSLTLFYG